MSHVSYIDMHETHGSAAKAARSDLDHYFDTLNARQEAKHVEAIAGAHDLKRA